MASKKKKEVREVPRTTQQARVSRKTPARFDWTPYKPTRGLWILLAVASLLRFPDLGAKSLWVDEMVDWNACVGTWDDVFKTVHQVPYVLSKLSLAFGKNEFFLRLPDAIFGVLSVLFIYVTGRLLGGERLGLLAGAILCFSPISIYFSQDSHYYSLMIGFSALVLMSIVWMTHRHTWSAVLLLLVGSFLCYKVHPAAIFVPLASLATLSLWFVLDRTLMEHAFGWFGVRTGAENEEKGSGRSSSRLLWGGGLAAMLVLGSAAFMVARRVMAAMASGAAEDSQGTPNFEISFPFFSKVLRDYGGALYDYGALNLAVALVVAALALLGWILLVRRREWLAVYLPMILVGPWVALSIRSYSHFFHIRYTSFIVPGLLLCAAIGLDAVATFVRTFAKKSQEANSGTPRSGFAYAMVLGLAGLLWAVPVAPNLFGYYRGEKQDWKGAAEYLRDHAEPNSHIANFLYCNYTSLEFYQKLLGAKPFKMVKLWDSSNAHGFALKQLKNLCRTGDPVYIPSSYQRYEPKELFDWVRANFDPVFNSPTLHPNEFNYEGKNVVVYKFRYSGRYLVPTETLKVGLDLGGSLPMQDSILVEASQNSTISTALSNTSTTTATAKISIDGKEVEQWAVPPGGKVEHHTIASLPQGPVSLALNSEGSSLVRLESMLVHPVPGEAFRIRAIEPDGFLPTVFTQEHDFKGHHALVMKRSAVTSYEFLLSSGVDRYLELQARHDAPGPVIIEAAVDGESLGVLSFDKGDNSWESLGLPFKAGKGLHRLEISFVNEGDVSPSLGEDADRDACIEWIDIYNSPPAETKEGFALIPDPVEFPPEKASTLKWTSPEMVTGWTTNRSSQIQIIKENKEDRDYIAKITMPPPDPRRKTTSEIQDDPGRQALFFSTGSIPARPNQTLYCSIDIRMENLLNHSLNLMLMYYDADSRELHRSIVFAQGVTMAGRIEKDFGWIRLVCIKPIPEGVSRVAPTLCVYPNGQLPSDEPGFVYVRPFRFHHNPESTSPKPGSSGQ